MSHEIVSSAIDISVKLSLCEGVLVFTYFVYLKRLILLNLFLEYRVHPEYWDKSSHIRKVLTHKSSGYTTLNKFWINVDSMYGFQLCAAGNVARTFSEGGVPRFWVSWLGYVGYHSVGTISVGVPGFTPARVGGRVVEFRDRKTDPPLLRFSFFFFVETDPLPRSPYDQVVDWVLNPEWGNHFNRKTAVHCTQPFTTTQLSSDMTELLLIKT